MLKCLRCGYEWEQRGPNPPQICANPRCRSRQWNKPKPREVTCLHCGHTWKAYKERPRFCPGCHRENWDSPVKPGQKLRVMDARNRQGEILNYFQQNGMAATMQEYGISQPMLERLAAGSYGPATNLTMAERAFLMAQIAQAGNADLRRELREMREQYSRLVHLISGSITAQIVKALQSIEIDIPTDLRHTDELDEIDDPLTIGPAPGE